MKFKNTKGEIIWIILIVIAGLVLSALALGLVLDKNKYISVFTNQYDGNNKVAEEDGCGFVLDEPLPKKLFTFPFTVSGKITGCGWEAFEGQVGSVYILDGSGVTVASEPLLATSPWMAEVVSFNQNLSMPIIDTPDGVLRFSNEDPSGENPIVIDIPVDFE